MHKIATRAWGPEQKQAAVSITFDNFGEAADIAIGRWPADMPIGHHYTATTVLPRLLEGLRDVRVSYFVEAVNAERYPEQLTALREAGHEIGLHAWAHESWARLSTSEQRTNLEKSLAAMHAIGVHPRGFRPPGGPIDAAGTALLREFGFGYCSPVTDDAQDYMTDGLLMLPYRWRHVDAYLIDPILAEFREVHGDCATPATADEWRAVLHAGLDHAVMQGQHLTLIFHPYLFGSNEPLFQVLLDFTAEVRARADVWLAPCGAVAEWINSESATRRISTR